MLDIMLCVPLIVLHLAEFAYSSIGAHQIFHYLPVTINQCLYDFIG
jgi:hypothetical protein